VACVALVDALAEELVAWEALQQRSPAASPFISWAWHHAWASTAPPEELVASYGVLLRGDAGAVDAILPVAVRNVVLRRQHVAALTWAIGDLGCPDHLDVPAAPGANWGAVVPVLKSLPWDVLILGNLTPGATNAIELARALARGGCAVRWEAQWPCPYIDLPSSWDDYLASVTATRRQALRRRERNMARAHRVTVVDHDVAGLDEGWRRLVDLHERRWGGAGTFSNPRVERLHRAFAAELAGRGQLWLSTLELDGQPAAAWYGFSQRDTVYFYQSGRDPKWEDLNVGAVLMTRMVRRAIESGYRRLDFLRGTESYKAQWTAAHRVTAELVAFRPSWRGQWLRGLDLLGRLRGRLRRRRVDRPT
jgi:CelD/BcsL family acetyltransferase involved in cellulose biosynthesis